MKTKTGWFCIIKVGLVMIIITIINSCGVQNLRKYNQKMLQKYSILEVKNTTKDTLIFPLLVFKDFDICPNLQIATRNADIIITVDLDLVNYVRVEDAELIIDGRLHYLTSKVPPESLAYFYLPKCAILPDVHSFDSLLVNCEKLCINVNGVQFEIPVSTLKVIQ